MTEPAAALPYRGTVHVVRGLRQALITVLACLAVALVVALLWRLGDGSFRTAFAVSLLVLAIVVGTAGGAGLGRLESTDARAFLGMGPETDGSGGSAALTPLGVTLFVGVPLFLAGLALLDLG